MYEGREERERERRTKLKFLHAIFSTVRRINGTLEVYFTLEYLRVSFTSVLHHFADEYLGVAPMP